MSKARRAKAGHLDEEAHTLPAVHALHLAELVGRWQVTPDQLLLPLGIAAAELAQPGARLSVAQAGRLVERARALTGEPGLGFYLGLQMRISAHGHLGFAAMTAGTLGAAIELAIRFAPTRTTVVGLRLVHKGAQASLIVDEHAPLGGLRETLIFTLLIGLWQIASALTGRELHGALEVAFPQPEYFHRFAHLARDAIRFEQPAHRLCFDAALLDLPLTLADPVAQRLAQEHCQKELDALGYGGPLAARVRELLPLPDGKLRNQSALAHALHVSVRTLKRRLAALGLSYSDLVDERRRERALVLLQDTSLTSEQIAERLGYSDAANFSRAFRRWTGTTPRRYRTDKLGSA
jgi:AraC-like DNA-binding protein